MGDIAAFGHQEEHGAALAAAQIWSNAVRTMRRTALRDHCRTVSDHSCLHRPVQVLCRVLRDPWRTRGERRMALSALARHGDPFGLRVVVAWMAHADDALAEEAAVWSQFAGALALPRLKQAVADEARSVDVRLASARALLALGVDEGAVAQVQAQSGQDSHARRLASLAAIVRGDRAANAAMALDGLGWPELLRWADATLRRTPEAAHESLDDYAIMEVTDDHTDDRVALLEGPGLSARAGTKLLDSLASHARLQEVERPGKLLYLAGLLGPLAKDLLERWHAGATPDLAARIAPLLGACGGACLRDPRVELYADAADPAGLPALLERIRSRPDADAECARMVPLHRLLHHIPEDDGADPEAESITAALQERHQRFGWQPTERWHWLCGELRLAGTEPLLQHEFAANPWCAWSLGELATPAARDILAGLAAHPPEKPDHLRQLLWACADLRVGHGRLTLTAKRILPPSEQALWRYLLSCNLPAPEFPDPARAPGPERLALRVTSMRDGDRLPQADPSLALGAYEALVRCGRLGPALVIAASGACGDAVDEAQVMEDIADASFGAEMAPWCARAAAQGDGPIARIAQGLSLAALRGGAAPEIPQALLREPWHGTLTITGRLLLLSGGGDAAIWRNLGLFQASSLLEQVAKEWLWPPMRTILRPAAAAIGGAIVQQAVQDLLGNGASDLDVRMKATLCNIGGTDAIRDSVCQPRTYHSIRSCDSLGIWVLAHGLCCRLGNAAIDPGAQQLMRGLLELLYWRNNRIHGATIPDSFDEQGALRAWSTLLQALAWMRAVHLRQAAGYT